MAQTDWRLSGEWVKNCNCAFGCPCDFNARPTHGDCRGLVGMRIQQGHFGDVRLDGLSFFVMVDFPGPFALVPETVKANESAPLKPGFDW